jgi:translation elongation factor EF-4
LCERQLLYVAIQAAIGGRIIARETVKTTSLSGMRQTGPTRPRE